MPRTGSLSPTLTFSQDSDEYTDGQTDADDTVGSPVDREEAVARAVSSLESANEEGRARAAAANAARVIQEQIVAAGGVLESQEPFEFDPFDWGLTQHPLRPPSPSASTNPVADFPPLPSGYVWTFENFANPEQREHAEHLRLAYRHWFENRQTVEHSPVADDTEAHDALLDSHTEVPPPGSTLDQTALDEIAACNAFLAANCPLYHQRVALVRRLDPHGSLRLPSLDGRYEADSYKRV